MNPRIYIYCWLDETFFFCDLIKKNTSFYGGLRHIRNQQLNIPFELINLI